MADSAFLSRLPIRGAVATSAGSPDAFKVPVLNADGKLDASLLADKVIYEVPDLAAMLALPNLSVGDLALRLDTRSLCLLTELPSNVESNWRSLGTGINYPVTSVAGKTGDVTLTTEDISGLTEDLAGLQPAGDYVTSEDPRLTNSRTPTNHAANHAAGGVDAITPTSIGAANRTHTHTVNQITDFPVLGTAAGLNAPLIGDATPSEVVLGNDSRLNAAANKVDISSVGQPGGVASLNNDGKIPLSELPSGMAATITVGTTTTANPGENAQVVNVGTNNEAVLDFTIPKGNPGLDGAFELDSEGNLIPVEGAFSSWGLSEGTFHLDEDGNLTPTDVILPAGGGGAVGYKLTATTSDNTPTLMSYGNTGSPTGLTEGQAIQFQVLVIGHNRNYDTASAWKIEGAMLRSYAGVFSLVGNPTVTRIGASWGASASVTVGANSQTFVPTITVTGPSNASISWAANISITNTESSTAVPLIYGCTDPSADNYNPAAQANDGSCSYLNATSEMYVPVEINAPVQSLTATLNGATMFPSFDPNIYDYAITTNYGDWHNVTVSVVINGTAQDVKAQTNRLIQIKAQGSTYYIRVLNATISNSRPQIQFGPTENAPAGYWLYAWNGYYIVANEHGVPMWYIAAPLGYPLSLHVGGSTNRLAGNDGGGQRVVFEVKHGQPEVRIIQPTLGWPDSHEVEELTGPEVDPFDGTNRKNHVILEISGSDSPVFQIEEQDENGNVTWSWQSGDWFNNTGGDAFHINSVDVHPITGNIVVSSRHMSAVFEIDYATKRINWVIQGQSVLTQPFVNYAKSSTLTHTKILNIVGEPAGWRGTSGNHDARYHIDLVDTNDIVVSVYDDGSFASVPHARGVIYRINLDQNTATNISSTMIEDQGTDSCCGSYTVYKNPDGVITHAFGSNNFNPPAIEYIGGLDTTVREKVYAWSPGGGMYRCVKAPENHFNIQLLRSCWTQQTQPPEFNPDNGGGGGALANGLRAYWKLNDDGAGNVGLNDSTANAHNLTNNNGVSLTDGKIGKAASFNSSLVQSLSLPVGALAAETSFSASAWFKISSTSSGVRRDIFDSIGDIGFGVGLSGSNTILASYGSNGNPVDNDTGYAITDTNWHQAVYTFDGTINELKLYVDGVLINTTTTSGTAGPWASGYPTSIGATGYPGYMVPFDGQIDEVGFWGRVLTQTEVTRLYNGGAGFTYPFSANPLLNGLTAYWKLDNDGANNLSLIDASGNGNTLSNLSYVGLGDGKIAGAALIGPNNYLKTSAINVSGTISVSLWVKPSLTQTTDYPTVICLDPVHNKGSLYIHDVTTPNGFRFTATAFDNTITLDTWNHFVLSYSSGVTTIYLNGVLMGTDGSGLSSSEIDIGTANNQYIDNSWFSGLVDEVGVWNRELTASDVSTLYFGGRGLTYPFDTNPLLKDLAGYWSFEEASGARVDSYKGLEITETNGTVGNTSGVLGNAARITNGDSAWLTLPPGICDIGSNSKTFSMWFYTTRASEGYQWIGPMQGSGRDYTEANIFYIEGAGFLNCIFTTQDFTWTNYISYTGNSAPTPNVWHHAAAVFDGSTCTLYYDGKQVNQQSYNGAVISRGGSYTLGEYNPYNPSTVIGGSSAFNGSIDELAIWDRALTEAEILKIYNSGEGLGYPFKQITDNLDGYWKLDNDGSGAVSLADSSGNGYTLVNDGYVALTAGKIGEGASLSGSNKLFNSNITIESNFTMSCWVNSTVWPEGSIIMGQWNYLGGSGPVSVAFGSNFGNFNVFWSTDGGNLTDRWQPFSLNFINDGNWHHLALTFDGAIQSIYLDGALMATNTPSGPFHKASGLSIGFGNGGAYPGKIDEVGVWSRALDGYEIAKIYNSGRGLSYPLKKLGDGVKAYWKFDDNGAGSLSLLDSVSNQALTNNGGVTLGDGKIHGGAGFDGNGQYLSDSSISAVNWGTDDFSFSIWLKPNSFGKSPINDFGETIVDFRTTGTGGAFLNITTSGYLRLWGTTTYTSETALLPLNSWSHVVLTKGVAGYKMYVNGVLTDSFTDAGDDYNSSNILFGKNYDGLVPFDGVMDEAGLWGRELAHSDIYELYAKGSGFSYPFKTLEDNLLVYWGLDNNGDGGVNLADSSYGKHTLSAPNGTAGLTSGAGKIGGAATFNGDNNTYLRANGRFLSPGGVSQSAYSVSLWLKTTNDLFIVESVTGNNWGGGAIELDLTNGRISPTVWWGADPGGSYDRVTAGPDLRDNQWHHLAFTWKRGGSFIGYVDGVQVFQQAASSNPVNVNVNDISVNANSDGTYATGRGNCSIDEVGIWNRELSLAEITKLYNQGEGFAYPFKELSEGVTAYWGLDNDGSGAVSLVDATGNGYTLANNGNIVSTSGRINECALLNGGGQYFITNKSLPAVGTGEFSVSMWVNISAFSDPFSALFTLGAWSNGNRIGLLQHNDTEGGIAFIVNGSGDVPNISPIQLNQWNHVVCVRKPNAGNTDLYINNVLVHTTTLTNGVDFTNGQLILGSVDDNQGAFNPVGKIDEVGIWDRALSSQEVSKLYNSGVGFAYPFAPQNPLLNNIEAYWKLDNDGSGAVSLVDSTGNNHALVNNGGITLGGAKIGNGSAYFNGTDNNLTCPLSMNLSSGAYSVCGWFKSENSSGVHCIFGHTAGLNIYVADGYLRLDNFAVASGLVYPVADNTWNFFSFVSNGTTNYFYGNGQLIGSAGNGLFDIPEITIGSQIATDGHHYPFYGNIDEIGVWSRALSSSEVAALYNNGAGLTYPTIPKTLDNGVLAYWNLDTDNSYNINLNDSSGNGNNLVSNNGGLDGNSGLVSGGVKGNGNGWLKTSQLVPLPGDFSINFWLKNPQPGAQFFTGSSGVGLGTYTETNDASYFGVGKTDIYNGIITAVTFNPGWNMYTVVRSGNTVSGYLNTVFVASYQDTSDFTSYYGVLAQAEGSYVAGSANVEIDEIGVWARALTASEVVALYNNGAGLGYPFNLRNSLEAYWGLDNNGSGGLNLLDASGNGRNLTATSGVSLGDGKIGGDAVLDGVTGCLTLSNYSMDTNNFSVSLWYYPYNSNEGTFGAILDTRAGGAGFNGFYLGYTQGANAIDIWTNGNFQGMGTTLTMNSWNHIVVTRNGNTFKLYLNGSVVSSKNIIVNLSNNTLLVGNAVDNFPVNGEVDEIGVWSRALSDSEVAQLINNGKGLDYGSF